MTSSSYSETPSSYSETPSSYSETEVQIFEAALKAFAHRGRDGARMQEIADAAGINKAMLHYYFRSKDRLYEEVVGYVMRRFLGAFGEAMREAETFGDTLRVFVEMYIDIIGRNPDVFRLIAHENLAGGQVMGRHIRRVVETVEIAPPRLLARRIAEAVERGEIRPVDPTQMLLTIVSACIMPFLVRPLVNGFNPDAVRDWDAFMEARKQHVFETLYDGLRVRPPAS